ncbi:Ig-like domain repeat protein [Granulicella paludicola]|uniref:Ig-like domain repeat protein n=1 Tax=Granulicella paludicola TaxID=474951 RepID=UPI0021DF7349|nr:Ig-like domain repeat protein [Granulicella paludicola]
MRYKHFFAPVASPSIRPVSAALKGHARKLLSTTIALTAMALSGSAAKAQTLSVNGVTDLYSSGYSNFAATQVGQSVTQNVPLLVSGGTVTITSFSIPAPATLASGAAARTQQFKTGALTGCTVGTAAAANAVCNISVTFTPAYVGYQTSPLTVVTNRGTFQFGLNGVGVGPQAVLMPGILSSIAGDGTASALAGSTAGTGTTYTGDGGQATAAQVNSHGFSFDALGNLYEAEFSALAVRKITAAGVISTVAGASGRGSCATTTGACGDGAAATAATFSKNLPDVAFDSAGNMYIADLGNNRVRRVDAVSGNITTIAGTGTQSETGDGKAATAATLNTPEAVVVDSQDNLYILDSNASVPTGGTTTPGATVRFIAHDTGFISTIAGVTATPCAAGTGQTCGDGGPATAANIGVAASFYVDQVTGNYWIVDKTANRIRYVSGSTVGSVAKGTITTVAGTGAQGYTGDGGAATAATFNQPHGIWVDPAGDLYISDRGNNVVRFVSSASGVVTTMAGGGATCTASGNGSCGDGTPANSATANLTPDDVRLDSFGNLYIADQTNFAIRKITQNPITLTFPTVPVGNTAGPLTASLVDIGSSTLTYTTPASGSNAAVTSADPDGSTTAAFAQANTTTCGPIYSTSTSGNTLGAGATCNFVVTFTPKTTAGNYTGTLIETDDSFNAGATGNTVYPTAATQLVSLVGAATQATATVGLATNPNPSTYNQSVALTSTVTGAGTLPTGTVTFTYTPTGSTTAVTIGTATISTTSGSSVATLNTSNLPVGTDTILATYNGDGTYVAGTKSGTVAQVVNLAPVSADTLTVSPSPATTGQTVTISFTVPTATGNTAPSAATSVTFTYTPPGSTTPITITAAVKGTTANGVTTYTTTTALLPIGTDTIIANFTGDANYATGSLSTPETVNAIGPVGQAVTVATNPTTVGSADTITYSIPVVIGSQVPTGSVSFVSGSTTLGSATFPATPTAVTCPVGTGNCYTVSISTTALPLTVSPATSTPVTGTYTAGGTSGYSSGTANTTVVVNQVSSAADAVTAANKTTTVGTADPLTYSIPVVTGVPAPAGTVTFASGSTNLGSATWPATPTTGTCPSGSGTCYLLADAPSPTNIPLTTAPATSTPITATYTATAASGYASGAPTTTVVVNPAGGSGDTLTVATNPTTFGASDTLTFSIPVTSGAPAPAGSVVFTVGSTSLGTATWPASPTASGGYYTLSLTTSALPVGSPTTVVGTYTATAASGYGSAAPQATVTVNSVPLSNDGISATPSATTSGNTVTIVFSVPTVNGTAPATTSSVTFTYVPSGSTTPVTIASAVKGVTSNGTTTYTTTSSTLPVGTDTVTGTFTGDTNYAGGALSTPVAISSNSTTDTVTATPATNTVGSTETITFSIPVVTGASVPTGSVAFTSGSTSLGNATWNNPTPVACGTGTCYTISITTTALPLTVAPSTSTPVLATYSSGTGSGYSSATATTTVVINQVAGGGDTVVAASGTISVGSPDALTFYVPVVSGAPVPSGTVAFTSGSTNLGSATWPASPVTGSCAAGTCYILADSPTPTNIPLTVAPATSSPVTATYTAGSGSGYASTTATTSVVVTPASGTGDTLTAAPTTITYGASDTLTFSIPVVSGAPAPTGTVTYSVGTTTLGTATWPANPTATGGVYSLPFATTNLPVGSPTTVSAAFTPSSGSGYGTGTATTTVTVNPVPLSNDGISATPSATTSGNTVTIVFSVPTVNGTAPATTSSVTFTYVPSGSTTPVTITSAVKGVTANGTTTYTTTSSTLPVGTDTVTGTFTGDTNYAGGALSTPVAISSNSTTDTVTATPATNTVGSTETITFSIPVVTGASVPTGSVAFTSGSTSLGNATWALPTPVACGTGTCYTISITTTALPLTVAPSTSTPVLATYSSGTGSGYSSATATTTVVINQVAGTSDAVTAANSTTTVGSADPLTFSIPVVSGAPAPTGSVSFTSGSTNLGSATWPATPTTGTCPNGTGTCYLLADNPSPTNIPLTVAPATSTPVTATYTAGSGSGYASTTATTTVDVTPVGGTGGTLSVANNPTTYGTPDTLTFSIPVTSGVPAPAGTVVFTAGSGTTTALGSATWPATPTAVNGFYTLSISPSNIPVGSPTALTATFTPTAGSGYGASAPTANVTVNPVPVSSDSIAASPNPQTFGSAVTLVFSVPTANSTPPSAATTVTFTNGSTVLGTANITGVTANGVTTYTTTTSGLPVGSDTVTGTLTGDTNYASGALSTVEVINAATGAATLTANPNPTTFGTPVTLTETIAPIGGACPSGPATFLSNGTSIGAGAISLVGGSCVATLTTSTLPVGTDNITATVPASNGFAAITSGPVAVTINKAPASNNTLTTSPNPSTFGQTVTISLAVPTEAGTPATGTVTFYNNGASIGTGTVTNGVATVTTATLPVGTDPITATYAGDANYATGTTGPVNQVVNASNGTSNLTATPNPTTFGTPVTLTETITPINGTCPTGPATFLNNGTSLGTGAITLQGTSCVATLTTSTLPVGTDNITATVPASNGFAAITSGPVAVTINKAPASNNTLTTSPNPSTFGQTVTISLAVPTEAGTPATGTVTFFNNGTSIGTGTVTNGVATLTTATLPVGTDPITATYAGDANYATGTTGPVNQVVNASNGAATLTANPNPTTFGTPVTLTETIAPINGTCPTGPATFLDNGTSIGTGAISLVGTSCVATLTTSTLPVGTDNITATVPASGGFAAIASGPISVVVGKAAGVGDTLTTNPNPSTFGNPVVVTETLPTVGGVAPTGTVTFYNNGTSIGTGTIVAGVATITTSTLPAGTDPITATYAGDANYAIVTSGPVQQVVNTAGTAATLAAGPNPATFGTPVTLTEAITPINGVCPAGPATFLNNGTVIGTGALTLTNGSCVASITSSTLPVGTDSITATVPASNGFADITSGPVALVINKANGADTLTSSPNPSVFGTTVTITDTIPTVGGVAPTGTVNFYSFGTLIGPGTITNGVATITTATLPVGTDSLTGVYLGDSNYAQVTAGPVNQVVTAVSTVATLAAGPNPANFGTTVTITETIPVTNGTPATGTVTFFSNGTQIGTGTLVNGVATITSSTLPVGTDAITATYPGDTNYSKVSSGPVNEIINKANGADVLTVNPDPAQFGSVVTMVDTIPTVGGVAPTGTVSFYNNGVLIGTGTVDSTGKATLTSTTLPIGTDPITAVYNGDGNYAPVSTGPVNETITQFSSLPVLSATPNPAQFGTTVTLTESIPGVNGVTPTGSVTFTYNGTTLGTATVVNGVATLTTTTLPIGTDPVSATYTGDTTYAPATSGPLNVVITKSAAADTLTATPNPSIFGGAVTLTFTVPPVNGVAPTGTVSFYNGTTLLGTATVNAAGVATITTSALPYGTDTVVAQYPGDNNYAPEAPTVTVNVTPVTPTSVVTVPTTPPVCGSSVTLTDTITAVNGVALGGTVQFYVNGVAFGSPIPVPASGVVTLTSSTLPCTTDVITAVYTPPAGSPYGPSTGGPTTLNVLNPDFSIAATPPTQTVNPGDSATYTISLSGVNVPFTSPVTLTATGLPPGATVTFANPTYIPNAGPTTTTMTIVTSPTQAMLQHGKSGGLNGVYYGLLLLPLLGIGSVRRKIRALPKGITYCLAAMALLGGLGAMTGCGGGYFGPAPNTYTITVTGTSGTLVHSTTVTLTVR